MMKNLLVERLVLEVLAGAKKLLPALLDQVVRFLRIEKDARILLVHLLVKGCPVLGRDLRIVDQGDLTLAG